MEARDSSGPLRTLVERLVECPGIGERSAERIAFHLFAAPESAAQALADAIMEVKHRVRPCARCLNLATEESCAICADPDRDAGLILVVEHPKDVEAFERAGSHRGLYHVLLSRVSPHDGVGRGHLGLDRLHARVKKEAPREVVLATATDAEGDATALAVARALADTGVKTTRLARGLPSGFSISYAGTEVLADALEGRREVAPEEGE